MARVGVYGNYYGSAFDESYSLTLDEMKVNAKYIYLFLKDHGWSKNAIAGMLGNIQAESSMNPGRWQSEDVGNTSLGYGLVQWTPATKYLSWCTDNGYNPSDMDSNLERIIYELENNIQWIATDTYNFSFKEFSTSTESAEYLASAFLKCYERAGVEVESIRRSNANYWFSFLEDVSPGNPSASTKRKKKKFKFILFRRRSYEV